MTKKRGLGKGLGALIPVIEPGPTDLPVDAISPNPLQPRQKMAPQELEELAASIREHGLIQPLIVSQVADAEASYQLIAGERRLEAAKLAGLTRVPVIVREATPQEMLELALVENIQRADLNPLEEAGAYQQLNDEFGLTQERIAERVGRSRASVANAMRLLRLPQEVKDALVTGEITEGHARALLMLSDEDEQLLALHAIVRRHLSVRQAEELVRRLQAAGSDTSRQRTRSPETEALEAEFRESLGTRVDLYRSRRGGRLVIHFYSEEDLQAIYDRIVGGDDA